ncbi:MAG: hypothetical protein VX641_06690, partial [Planctomycetota bacterium]|nr:hypothetical protein [Planctomycetota bacterium]
MSTLQRTHSPVVRVVHGLVASLSLLLVGCESMLKLDEIPPEFPAHDSVEVSNRFGGTHYRTIVRGRIWYQTFESELLVLDTHDGSLITRIEPYPFGTHGALVDMLIHEDRLYLVCEGDAVIEFDLTDQRLPVQRQIRPSRELGLRPQHVSVVDGEVWISGLGGAVTWDSSEPPADLGFPANEPVGRVVPSAYGPVAPIGRRVHSVLDGRYVGAASRLEEMPVDSGLSGGLMFVLQGTNGASVGIMDSDVRERSGFVM